MKSYTNPQPYAVDRIDKSKNKSHASHSEKDKPKKENKTNTEIYRNESEEEAWRDVLEKDNPHHKSRDK